MKLLDCDVTTFNQTVPEKFYEPLEFTGERMVPESAPRETFWEHVYRYRFAAGFVKNKRVLDIASGEGYGAAALLSAGAKRVVGIDVSEEACMHSRRKYGLDVRYGKAESIPLQDHSIDIVVSFETIEHVKEPGRFLDECTRILAPGGSLIISTPNKDAYGEAGSGNPFHCCELTEDGFTSLLRPRFASWRLYTQLPVSASWWTPRSLVAINSSWVRVKGFCRIRELLRAATCPHTLGDVDERYRRSPQDAILGRDNPLSNLVNQYSVLRRLKWHQEQPLFFVAVAKL